MNEQEKQEVREFLRKRGFNERDIAVLLKEQPKSSIRPLLRACGWSENKIEEYVVAWEKVLEGTDMKEKD